MIEWIDDLFKLIFYKHAVYAIRFVYELEITNP